VSFRVLRCDGDDLDDWRRCIDRLPADRRDIHYLPEYGRIYRLTYAQEPFLAVLEDAGGIALQPFVRRRLHDLPFLHDRAAGERYCDIANAYGYGGVLVSGDVDEASRVRAFEAAFLDYCRSERYASEFASVHPRFGVERLIAQTGTAAPMRQKSVVYIDCACDEAQRWGRLRKGHKSSITKARRSGVQVDLVDPTAANFAQLNRLYTDTMRRNNAQARWFFPEDYFRNCMESLGSARCSLFFARIDDQVIAASIVIHAFDTAYYHFSGSNAEYQALGAGNLLVYEISRWAHDCGYRWLHLGGGVSNAEDDSLFRFKSGFSDITRDLYVYGRILHEPTYAALCALKRSHEAATGAAPARIDYFPLYRR
jgi:hypothetical protein